MARQTQREKIIRLMLRRRGEQKWFKAQDFMQPGLPEELFVGYEASARLSELAKEYPEFISTQLDGRYHARSLNIEAMQRELPRLSASMRQVYNEEMGAEVW